jgi:hypothetical protein
VVVVRPGVTHRFLYAPGGPWAIHLLDVDRRQCWTPRATKSLDRAAGREKTSTSIAHLAARHDVAGGANADFFVTTGSLSGLPTGAFVSDGRVIAGPGSQAVFAIDSSGRAYLGTLGVEGSAAIGGTRLNIDGWNRDVPRGLALFDAAWGPSTDTASSIVEVALAGSPPYRVVAVDRSAAGVAIPTPGVVLRAGRDAAAAIRDALAALAPDDTVRIEVAITPFHPREAVGGRPVLVRDSAIVAGIDTVGQTGFATGRHPRTAVGVGSGGRRLLLAVVDGRQAPYSDGMTLRELATLMQALGAREAINLDGGGSTALVVSDSDASGGFRVANRPSDPTGERAVGNALAIVRECAG